MNAARESLLSSRRPFPGLRPFAYEDHAFFFGRQDQVFSLYRLVDRSRFVAVVGSSGSGKSSLVRAGLLPLLDREKTSVRAPVWRRVEMRPGDAPLENLAAALAGLAADDDPSIALVRRERIAFQLRYASIEQALLEAGGTGESKLLLLVDQFEELFRFAGPRRELAEEAGAREDAVRFVQLLIDASRGANCSITIVLTMRSDFIGECARFQGLPEVVSASQYLVPALTRDQREEVIRAPIKKAGATIDPILVERLLNDSGSDLDQLPVLQHCLLRIWHQAGKREGTTVDAPAVAEGTTDARKLTEDDYEAIGRMHRAMSQHADEISGELPGKGREIERVFRALSELRDNRAIRRVVPLAALAAETGASEADLKSILDAFRDDDCSFVTPPLSGVETLAPDRSIDIGHEALLRRWEKLTGETDATGEANDKRRIGWLREERRDARRYEALLSMVENDTHGDVTLDPKLTAEYADWWGKLKPTPAWGARYGGGFQYVEKLIERSLANVAEEIRRRRNRQWVGAGSIAFAIALVFAFFTGFNAFKSQLQLQKATQVLALRSANNFVAGVHKSLTAGDTTVRGAVALLGITNKIAETVSKNISSDEALALNIKLMLAEYDVYYISGDMDTSLALAQAADRDAKRLAQDAPVAIDERLLPYETAFRLGDMAARNKNISGALA